MKKNELLVSISGNYFNRNQVQVGKQLAKRDQMNRFLEDIINNDVDQQAHSEKHEVSDNGRTKLFRKPKEELIKSNMFLPHLDNLEYLNLSHGHSPTPKYGKDHSKPTPTTNSMSYRPASSRKLSLAPSKSPNDNTIAGEAVSKNISGFQSPSFSRFLDSRLPNPRKTSNNLNDSRSKFLAETEKIIKDKILKDDKTPQCSVCMERDSNVVFDPCNHGGFCRECAVNCYTKNDKQCPLCRIEITKIIRIENAGPKIFRIVEDITPRVRVIRKNLSNASNGETSISEEQDSSSHSESENSSPEEQNESPEMMPSLEQVSIVSNRVSRPMEINQRNSEGDVLNGLNEEIDRRENAVNATNQLPIFSSPNI